MLMNMLGAIILKSFNNELNEGDSAKAYVAPQKIDPISSKYLPKV